MKKITIFIFLVLVVFTLQAVLIGGVQTRWSKPDLLLILLVLWAWRNGWKRGLLAGFAIGLLEDIFFFPILGLRAFSLALIGFLVGEMRERIYQENVIFLLLMMGVVTVLNGVILSLWLSIFHLSSSFLGKLIPLIFPAFLYNCLLAFPVFLVEKVFAKKSSIL